MGSGKTSAAINYINNSPDDERIIYVTPYLDEVKRIIDSCPSKNFQEPLETPTKKQGFLKLISSGKNIVTTHALFLLLSSDDAEIVKEQEYNLLLDEAIDVYSPRYCSPSALKIAMEDGYLKKNGNDYIVVKPFHRTHPAFEGINSGNIIVDGYTKNQKNIRLMWEFSSEVFKAFNDIMLFTYMFDSNPLKAYFLIHGLTPYYLGVEKVCGESILKEITKDNYDILESNSEDIRKELSSKISIIMKDRLNKIGGEDYSLSKWRAVKNNKNSTSAKELKINIRKAFRSMGAKSGDSMWTTYESMHRKIVSENTIQFPYLKAFLNCSAKSTNLYSNRHCLAYCINRFQNPCVLHFLEKRGFKLNSNRYVLSEMLQWIWRSAIRKGEPIQIYIPSKRMRSLLIEWLEDISPENKV